MNKKTLLKVLALVLTAAVAFTVVHFAVIGNNTPVDTTFTFALDGDNAILTGSPDALSGAVVLPAELSGHTVTGIGDDAFKDCADVTAFFLPDTITSIGSYAFANCTSLRQMILPDGLARISDGAFWKCAGLLSVTIPASVTAIGSCAFYKCTALKSLIVQGASTPIRGIFNVALDIGQTLAIHNPARDVLDPVDTTVYCYNGSEAYSDALRDQFSNYQILDNLTQTSYTVRYVDSEGAEVAEPYTLTQQPAGISVAAVAVALQDDTLQYPAVSVRTLTLAADADNIITFVYENTPTTTESTTAEETTIEETTTEPTTEETTQEETTIEETTVEETTIEETTVEETTAEETTVEETTAEQTTAEPTTVEPTTEEETIEPPLVPPVLYAREGSGATIDRERGYIYGLEEKVTDDLALSKYLLVEGDGHLEFSERNLGTGSTISLISDIDGSTVETFTVVLFGDLNGDGTINNGDLSILKAMIVGSIVESDNPAVYFAADILPDNTVNNGDLTPMKSIIIGSARLVQSTRDLVRI